MPYRRYDSIFSTQARCEALVAVADAGSITEAAKNLGQAQPPLTNLIKRLERESGMKLFERRGNHGSRPTTAGAVAVDRARLILHHMREAEKAVERAREVFEGEGVKGEGSC